MPQARAAVRIDRIGNLHEVLQELRGHVLVRRLHLPFPHREFQRHAQHAQAVEGHPRGGIRLLQTPAGRQRSATVKDPDVIQPQEAAGEDAATLFILLIHPPGEVHQQLVEDSRQEGAVTLAVLLLIDLIHTPRRPRMDRRVHIAEGKLIGRDLPIGMHEPLTQQQLQLMLGKLRIDLRIRHHVEGQIPRGEPRILPLVRHRDYITGEEMAPVAIAALHHRMRRQRQARVSPQPLLHRVGVELLAPDQPGICLERNLARLLVHALRHHMLVELITLRDALVHDLIKVQEGRRCTLLKRPQAQLHRRLLARLQIQHKVPRTLRPAQLRIHHTRLALHHMLVEGILHKLVLIRLPEELLVVRRILREDQALAALVVFEVQAVFPQRLTAQPDAARALLPQQRLRLPRQMPPAERPDIAKPNLWQQMQLRRLRRPVRHRDTDQNVVRGRLRILHRHIEVAIVVKQPRILDLILILVARAPAVFLQQIVVGEGRLRILVERLLVAVRRGRAQVVVALLHVLRMVALRVRQAKEPFLQEGILAIP